MTQSLAVTFGQRLRHVRRLAALTQAALAERAGISLPHLNKIERGAATPSLAVVGALAEALPWTRPRCFYSRARP